MKENSIDRVLILGGVTYASFFEFFKWLFSSETLTYGTLLLSFLLLFLRAIDWCIRRYRYGWSKSENTETISKE